MGYFIKLDRRTLNMNRLLIKKLPQLLLRKCHLEKKTITVHLIVANCFHAKAENERVTPAASRCRENLLGSLSNHDDDDGSKNPINLHI